MKHNHIITFAVLILGLGLQAAQAQTALFVKEKAGTNTPYNLSSLKMLTFNADNVIVNKKDASTRSYVRTNVQRMNFGNFYKSFDSDKPVKTFNSEYIQLFNTAWDSTTFYNQWDVKDPIKPFNANDFTAGYFQFEWIYKRVIISKNPYSPPYTIQTEIEYPVNMNQAGIVIRANPITIDQVQEPAQGDPGYNREGIAFYPTVDGSKMLVQFTGVYNGNSTPVTKILVPKPVSVASLKNKGNLRIEDFGTSIYVYYNGIQLTRINLGGKVGNIYTSGTVYNYKMEVAGTFTGMEVEAIGKVSVAQRYTSLKLYNVKIYYDAHEKQTINFPTISKKLITDAPFTISSTSTSGLPVQFSIVSGPATLVGNKITLTGEPGVVTLLATQYGNDAYFPANETISKFYVSDPAVNNVSLVSQDYVDNWVVTDALGRQLPSYDEAGAKRANKQVGVFYFLWLGYHGDKVYNTSKIIAGYPSDPMSSNNPGWGPITAPHFWGEPETGYHRSEDPWVIRRDLQMLSNAHVDFLYFDVTNGFTYLETVQALCDVSLQMRKEGISTPQIAFLTNSRPEIINTLYDEFYKFSLYDELWFKWDGKPLIIGNLENTTTRLEVKDFFTMRGGFAWSDPTLPKQWQWLDTYPQDYGWNTDPAVPEQLPVAVGSHPEINRGSSFSNNAQPPVNELYLTEYTGQGLHFAEQWKRALEVDPPVVMVTQWNEWTAERYIWEKGDVIWGGKPMKNGDSFFVDALNEEYNRDMVPMKGGHTDNYYYQLIANVRKYKGMNTPQVFSAPTTINLGGDFSQWQTISPVFKDPIGDVLHRNFRGYDAAVQYVNNTGRNDIVESRVTSDANNIYFYVKTVDAITAYTDPNWMLLFVDADRSKGTGWEGYDYVMNMGVKSATETTLKKWDGKVWGNEISVTYKLVGNEMVLSIPRTALLLDKATPEFYFKWADNPQQLNDITTFFTDGDAAPDRRFNFNFSTSKIIAIPETPFKSMNIPGTVEFEDFDNGGAGVAYADGTFGNSGGAYRPTESVDIEPTAGGGYDIGWINANEWLNYTVDVKAVGTYTANIKYVANSTGNEAILYVDGVDKSGVIAFPSSSGAWLNKNVDIQLTPGKHIIKFFIKNASSDFKLDKLDFIEKNVVYPSNGTGLNASIWAASLGGRTWFKDSICSQIDPAIDHAWGDVSPGCNVSNDFWNIRWQGQIQSLYSETHTFYLTVNDMGRVWINNQLVIDAWTAASSGTTISGTIDLVAGQKVPIKVDFAEKSLDASIQIEWSSPSMLRWTVPQSQLFPLIDPNGITDIPTAYFNIYPNPATNKLTINSGNNKVTGIKILDLQGRCIYTNTMDFNGEKIIDMRLEKGVYLLKLLGDAPFKTQKLIIK
ncbi:MAG: PA14 domain-containing protein [Bacteroidales bacterium]